MILCGDLSLKRALLQLVELNRETSVGQGYRHRQDHGPPFAEHGGAPAIKMEEGLKGFC